MIYQQKTYICNHIILTEIIVQKSPKIAPKLIA